ncbi:MAG: zinc ribbon domain-containing protein [Candidatus Thorarchaeota archaeon]|nr:zinc ribbon domain-containing protein [Candidatus Thorarchaeota archaeon]
MGDFGIPGAPFVLSLPDNWSVEQSTLPEMQANCIIAHSPQEEVEVLYYLYSASSLDEVIAESDYLAPLYSQAQFEINGMGCLAYNGLIPEDIMAIALWKIAPRAGAIYGGSDIIDYTALFVEHQGVIIHISITKELQSDEFSEHPALLVLSGVAPGTPFLASKEDPFSATAISPLAEMRQQTRLPTKTVQHKGKKLPKLKDKEPDLKALQALLIKQKPMVWCLNKLKEISERLEKDREFEQYRKDLLQIRSMLQKLWGYTDEMKSTSSMSVDGKHVSPPAPDSSAEKDEGIEPCKKCGKPILPSDKFCRICGASRAPRAIRWTPEPKS